VSCHEKIHTGQVLEGRYEARLTASPMDRLVADTDAASGEIKPLEEARTDLLAGPCTFGDQWTYRVVAKHVLTLELHSLETIAAARQESP